MTDNKLICARCGGEAPPGQMRYGAARDRKNPGKLNPAYIFCSDVCVRQAVADRLAMNQCHVCRGRYKEGGWFCSDTCEATYHDGLKLAAKELAGDKPVPGRLDKAEAALAQALSLYRAWTPRRGLSEQAEVPPAPFPPPDGSFRALVERIEKLDRGANELRAAAARSQAEENAKTRRARWYAYLERQAKAQKEWRDNLLDRI